MNSEFETRWEKISEVQIPEIKHLGFQEAVLDREIWNKAPEVEPEYHAYLVRENTNEKIDLDREKMILGKGSDVDYKLEGNKAISRRLFLRRRSGVRRRPGFFQSYVYS